MAQEKTPAKQITHGEFSQTSLAATKRPAEDTDGDGNQGPKRYRSAVLPGYIRYTPAKDPGLASHKIPFQLLVKEIMQEVVAIRSGPHKDFTMQSSAVKTLHEAAEAFLTCIFEDANLVAFTKKRVTVHPEDMLLGRIVKATNQKNKFRDEVGDELRAKAEAEAQKK